MIDFLRPLTPSITPGLAGAPAPFSIGGNTPALLSPLDFSAVSPEAMTPEANLGGLLTGLGGAYGMPVTDPMNALQQQQQLQALLALLIQLLGAQSQSGSLGGGAGVVPSGGSGSPSPGGGASSGGAPPSAGGGSGGSSSGGGATSGGGGSAGGGGSVGPSASGPLNKVSPKLAGDDKKLAQHIENQLKGSPLAGQGLGAHFVKAGRQNDVDPLALVAISKHETSFGKLGVGVSKHMGVGAFDSSPSKARQWDGATNQIYSGAKTFANLRSKGGSNSKASLSQQLSAVNKAGWATDSSWHSKVGSHYNEVTKKK